MQISGSSANSAGQSYCLSLARWIGISASLTGALVLLGWALDIAILKSALPGYATMKPLTATCFVLCGIALAVYSGGTEGFAAVSRIRLATPLAAAVAASSA